MMFPSSTVFPACRLILFFMLATTIPIRASDKIVLEGIVVDRETGRELSQVIVQPESGESTRSDKSGTFRLEFSFSGSFDLSFSHEGYTPFKDRYYLEIGKTYNIRVEMNKLAVYRDEVVVESVHIPEVEPVDFVTPDYVVNAPGAFEDTLQSIQAMPGVVAGSDDSARLFIRGGRPDQNGIFMDGIPVYDPYRLFGLTSLFNPETIRDVRLIPGGFDARYGDRLSAVIDVENRHGDINQRFKSSLNISLTNANLVAEGRLFTSFPSSWLFSARRTYYDLLLKEADEEDSSYPSFMDVQGLLYFQPDPRNQWTVTMLRSDEGSDLYNEEETIEGAGPDQVDLVDDQKNTILGLNGSHILRDNIRLSYLLAFTENRQTSSIDFLEAETNYRSMLDQNLTNSNTMFQADLEWYLEKHTIEGGFCVARSDNEVRFNIDTEDPRWDIPDDLLHFGTRQDFDKYGGYIQDTWELVHNLELKSGLRWDSSTLSDMSKWSPRLSLRWQPSDAWTFRGAWGYYYQFPSYETLQGDGYFLDLRGIKSLHLKPELALHYILSTEYTSPSGWSMEADVYYKDLRDLYESGEEPETVLILNDDNREEFYTRDSLTYIPGNLKSGYSTGMELTFKLLDRPDRPYYGMLTYSMCEARSRKVADDYHYEDWDRRHSLTWIAGWKINDRWEIGWKWLAGSGFPYTPVTRVIRVVDDANGNGVYEPELGETFSYQRDDPDSALRTRRLPFYHRLDFRVQYTRQFKHFDAVYYLDIINLYAQENVIGYYYNADFTKKHEDTGLPILPSFGIKIRY